MEVRYSKFVMAESNTDQLKRVTIRDSWRLRYWGYIEVLVLKFCYFSLPFTVVYS